MNMSYMIDTHKSHKTAATLLLGNFEKKIVNWWVMNDDNKLYKKEV